MDDRMVRRKSLSERLGFKGISCCGATWALMTSDITATDGGEGTRAGNGSEEEIIRTTDIGLTEPEPTCSDQTPTAAAAASGMNLAAALAAERNYRAAQDNSYGDDASPSQSPSGSQIRPNIGEDVNGGSGRGVSQPATPFRVSLMKLLQETDGCDRVIEKDGVGGGDSVCCVCMVRKKGAAFIPCGHTFCRVCSRELWLNRGFCPLCNRSIIEILDIF